MTHEPSPDLEGMAVLWDKAAVLPDRDPRRIFFGGGLTSPTEVFDLEAVVLLPSTGRLLDMGCGNGWLTVRLLAEMPCPRPSARRRQGSLRRFIPPLAAEGDGH